METYTDIWKKYEKSKSYMDKKQIVRNAQNAWKYYIGEQWGELENEMGEKLPVMNITKQIIKYKVSAVCQNNITCRYSDSKDRPEMGRLYDILNDKFAQSWEKGKHDTYSWKVVKSAAITGDSYVFFGTDSTLDEPQVIGTSDILFGDENNSDIQKQPYIIIRERWGVDQAKKYAKEHGVSEEDIAKITGDSDTVDEILNKDEVDDKITVCLYMDKDEDGVVRYARASKYVLLEDYRRSEATLNNEAVRGQLMYPIVNMVWEEKPNNARGISEVLLIRPNQIELNKTLARRAITTKTCAFPRIVYDKAAVPNPEELLNVGSAIGVNTGDARSVSQAVAYLNAANISSDAQSLFNDLLVQTKELNGASDFATGNINPQRTSGSAIVAVRDQTQMSMNEQVQGFKQYVENIAKVWFDMWLVFDPDSFCLTDENGQTIDYYDMAINNEPSIRIDVSQDNNWTKFAEQQAIDNLLSTQQITFDEYAQIAPDRGAIAKSKLLWIAEKRKEEQLVQEEQMEEQQLQQIEQPMNNGLQ